MNHDDERNFEDEDAIRAERASEEAAELADLEAELAAEEG